MTTSVKRPSTAVAPPSSLTVSEQESPAATSNPKVRPAATVNVRVERSSPRVFAQV